MTRELVETQDNGLNLRYAYVGRNRILADIVSNDDKVKMFYHNDRLGSAVLATDNIGKVRQKLIMMNGETEVRFNYQKSE